jgi:hypothetical protein
LASLPSKHRWHSIGISLKAVRLCGVALLGFAMTRRNHFKTWSVFALECLLRLSDITQPLLKPSLPWPIPILPREPISVIRAAIHFALKKNNLPIAHNHFLLSQYGKGKDCASLVLS